MAVGRLADVLEGGPFVVNVGKHKLRKYKTTCVARRGKQTGEAERKKINEHRKRMQESFHTMTEHALNINLCVKFVKPCYLHSSNFWIKINQTWRSARLDNFINTFFCVSLFLYDLKQKYLLLAPLGSTQNS